MTPGHYAISKDFFIIHYFIDKLCTSALGIGGSPWFPPVVKLALNEYFDSRERKDPPVACAVRAGVVHPHDDEDMLKVRADDLGSEGMSAGLLEHDGHNVVPYVPLPQQLVVKEQGALISGTLQTLNVDDELCVFFGRRPAGRAFHPHLLFVVGRVRQQGRHVEHELVVLESCVQGLGSSGVGCGKSKLYNWHHLLVSAL